MTVRLSTKFKKDLKRYENRPAKIAALKDVPFKYKPHMLSGNYKGFMECHIEDNFLLIWIDEAKNTIKLVRLGTHQELFGK